MTIGMIGSGNVGGALGLRWAKAGHEVVFGTRDLQGKEVQQLVAQAGEKRARLPWLTPHEPGTCCCLATPWPATQQIVASLENLQGKILIDATNPLLPDLSGLTAGNTTSGAHQVAGWARGAKVTKAFNTVGSSISAGRPVLFYCGDDASAEQVTRQLAGLRSRGRRRAHASATAGALRAAMHLDGSGAWPGPRVRLPVAAPLSSSRRCREG